MNKSFLHEINGPFQKHFVSMYEEKKTKKCKKCFVSEKGYILD